MTRLGPRARFGGLAKMAGIVVLAVPLTLIGGEFLLREFLVRPAIVDAFLARADLQDDLTILSDPPHIAVVHIGNGLRPTCADNCFRWSDYGDVDVILALSPSPDIRGAVRVLLHCDTDDCIALPNQQGFFRAATDVELSMDESVSSRTCTELDGFAYAVQHCRWEESQAGQVVRVQHTMFWPYPYISLPASNKFAPIGSVLIDALKGSISGQRDLVEHIDQVAER